MEATRDRKAYQAHLLRRDVIHASEDELVVLLGPLALEPGTDAAFAVEYPQTMPAPPEVTVRFVPGARLAQLLGGCEEGQRDVPSDFDSLQAPSLERTVSQALVELEDDRPGRFRQRWLAWLKSESDESLREGVEIGRIDLRLRTEPEEGAYLFVVESQAALPGAASRFVAAVHNRRPRSFPAPDLDDLTDAIVPAVNLDPNKHGIIWFVHPIYFAEQVLRFALSDQVKDEMVNCEDLPDDLPAADDVLVRLQWGYRHVGLNRICLTADVEPDECLDTRPVEVVDRSLSLKDVIGGTAR
jgi:hypothetical protein